MCKKVHLTVAMMCDADVCGLIPTTLVDLELRLIEVFSEWLVTLLMPARHVLETSHLSSLSCYSTGSQCTKGSKSCGIAG